MAHCLPALLTRVRIVCGCLKVRSKMEQEILEMKRRIEALEKEVSQLQDKVRDLEGRIVSGR